MYTIFHTYIISNLLRKVDKNNIYIVFILSIRDLFVKLQKQKMRSFETKFFICIICINNQFVFLQNS